MRERSEAGEVTKLLRACRRGDQQAFERLIPLVYEDLRRIARRELGRLRRDQILDTTSLVHESYLHLVHPEEIDWNDRIHFLAVVSRAMRQVIVGHVRHQGAQKRGGGQLAVTLDERHLPVADKADRLLALDQALTRLGAHDERLVRVVECRFFTGMSEAETAAALEISLTTVQRDWRRARAYLRDLMAPAREEHT